MFKRSSVWIFGTLKCYRWNVGYMRSWNHQIYLAQLYFLNLKSFSNRFSTWGVESSFFHFTEVFLIFEIFKLQDKLICNRFNFWSYVFRILAMKWSVILNLIAWKVFNEKMTMFQINTGVQKFQLIAHAFSVNWRFFYYSESNQTIVTGLSNNSVWLK